MSLGRSKQRPVQLGALPMGAAFKVCLNRINEFYTDLRTELSGYRAEVGGASCDEHEEVGFDCSG